MSWVLILNSSYTAKPPAVVGGYDTREAAETAGDAATAFKNEEGPIGFHSSRMPFYISYVVIPGAATSASTGSTQVNLDREDDGKIVRVVRRF